jgi:hypothetical protein
MCGLEERKLTMSSQLKDFLDWPYLEQVFQLERCFISIRTGDVQEQVVYGFTSLSRDEIAPKSCSKKYHPTGGSKMACTTAEMSPCGKSIYK